VLKTFAQKLAHSKWTWLAPLALTIGGSFSGAVVRGLCLVVATGLSIWIFSDTELAKGTAEARQSNTIRVGRTILASVLAIGLAVGIFWVSNRLEAFGQNLAQAKAKPATPSAPTPTPDQTAAQRQSSSAPQEKLNPSRKPSKGLPLNQTNETKKKSPIQAAIKQPISQRDTIDFEDMNASGMQAALAVDGNAQRGVDINVKGGTYDNNVAVVQNQGPNARITVQDITANGNKAVVQNGPPAPPPIKQDCGGGNCAISVGQQGGITGQVFIDTHPRIALTDQQQTAIAKAMKPFGGRTAIIVVNGNTQDVSDFARRLGSALRAANVVPTVGHGFAGSEDGSVMLPFQIQYGDKDADMAKRLMKAMLDNHVLSGKQIGYHYTEGTPGQLSITLTPPN